MIRLFAALRPPRAMREALLALTGDIAGARWQDDDRLHITLRFIGEVDRRVALDIGDALRRIRHPQMLLAPAGLGRFDRKGRIDSLWTGITPRESVAALHRKIDTALVAIGLAPEARAYLPHITLARFGRAAGPVDGFVHRHAGLTIPAAIFPDFRLYESTLGRGGADYTVVERYPLG